MNKTAIVLLLVAILVVGALWLTPAKAPTGVTPGVTTGENSLTTSPTTSGSETTGTIKTTITLPDIKSGKAEVTFLDNGFTPATLTVRKGTTVSFQNGSITQVWPASANHPTHTVYPTTGGCIGSTFDACKGLKPGESWPFQFNVLGTWQYHDHIHPQFHGTIIVVP